MRAITTGTLLVSHETLSGGTNRAKNLLVIANTIIYSNSFVFVRVRDSITVGIVSDRVSVQRLRESKKIETMTYADDDLR